MRGAWLGSPSPADNSCQPAQLGSWYVSASPAAVFGWVQGGRGVDHSGVTCDVTQLSMWITCVGDHSVVYNMRWDCWIYGQAWGVVALGMPEGRANKNKKTKTNQKRNCQEHGGWCRCTLALLLNGTCLLPALRWRWCREGHPGWCCGWSCC